MKTSDPLNLPVGWRERVSLIRKELGSEETHWEAGYRTGWEECALRARELIARYDASLGERITDLLAGIASVKDARIATLEKDNAILKAQSEEIEQHLHR